MDKTFLGHLSISQEMTHAFARLSGDSNPLHVDPIAARRYAFGTTVVHGVCGTIAALDLLLSKTVTGNAALTNLKVQYNNPVRHGDTIDVFHSNNDNNHRLELVNNGKRAQLINVEITPQHASATTAETTQHSFDTSAITLDHPTFAQAAAARGDIALGLDSSLARQLFPSASSQLPASQIAALLGTTVIVGMKCPGMNSVFGGLKLSFTSTDQPLPCSLDYQTTSSDDRFNRLVISVNSPVCDGEIEAFYRASPVEQPPFKNIKPLLKGSEFAGQRALVIGGSRGLGEVTAKILAAGGASTAITYASGKADAERIAHEISNLGGHCHAHQYNVLNPDKDIFNCFGSEPVSHIYYLASPVIEKGDQSLWNPSLFDTFCRFYITGLSELLTAFATDSNTRKSPLSLFVPSTIFLDEPVKGFAEYCAAKSATETFVQHTCLTHPHWKHHAPRLPRLQTDQTSGISTTDPMQTVDILFNELLKLSQ